MLCPMVATFKESLVYSIATKLFLKMVIMGRNMKEKYYEITNSYL